ncbi:MAG: lasso peptide biosynthesis B2 protein [Pseudonocardiaceae bacterium]
MTTLMAVEPCAGKIPVRRRAMAWAVVASVTLALRALRFQRIEQLARLLNRQARQEATVHEVTDLLEAINQTSPWLPVRVACLERSLAVVLWCGLRRRSIRWRLGVRTPPFTAHAWVEIAGHPVGELGPVQSYLPILTIDTSRQEDRCPSPTTSSPRRPPSSTTRATSGSPTDRC